MNIKKIDIEFSVCKVEDYREVNWKDEFVFIGKTNEECSLVCPVESVPAHTTHREDGWKAMRIEGILDFSLIGILAPIATILAEKKIGIFAVSTFNTDYILVKQPDYDKALNALSEAGYTIIA